VTGIYGDGADISGTITRSNLTADI